jgi:nucleoside-diphosphate-sugar epimerase
MDLKDLGTIRNVVRQVQPSIVFHLAAAGVAYGSGSTSELLTVNTAGSAAILEASAELVPPARVVMAGSGFEYQPQERPMRETDPLDRASAYTLSKVAAADAARLLSSQIPVTILRLFGVYGPGERPPRIVPFVVRCARTGAPVDLTTGDQIRDYAYVGDVAEAFLRAGEVERAPGLQILNVGSGHPVSVRGMVEALADILKTAGLRAELRFGARPQRGDERCFYAPDLAALRRELGWTPPTTLRAGLEHTVEAMLGEPE